MPHESHEPRQRCHGIGASNSGKDDEIKRGAVGVLVGEHGGSRPHPRTYLPHPVPALHQIYTNIIRYIDTNIPFRREEELN